MSISALNHVNNCLSTTLLLVLMQTAAKTEETRIAVNALQPGYGSCGLTQNNGKRFAKGKGACPPSVIRLWKGKNHPAIERISNWCPSSSGWTGNG